MSETLTLDAVANALGETLATVCGHRLGPDATAASSDAPATPGLAVTVQVSGEISGRILAWFERSSAEACVRIVDKLETADEQHVVSMVTGMVADAAVALVAQEPFARLKFGTPVVTNGQGASAARGWYVAVPNVGSCLFSVGVDRVVAAPVIDERLGAVLDVHLPLVVRFGRAVMPLRAVSELGPGSVIDMGRSPEEPVELLVGERLIARGEVVVVGGNYGVRITQLAGGRDVQPVEREARMS